ncbi:GAF domain-containing protein [Anaeromyxobacter paludicola]|uniref:GAF domain-containing protein n=1 Tax=Anaeromyxobacter paludicola TaxID=2918171 RepID=A0ABN6NAZ4_9BACT|nr:GAF domain-containing protein [Anaeromyxobacter paludicola]BDG09112.1 hypothetical protein AMPC_22250 [Anaeromyxobacter paludicola]
MGQPGPAATGLEPALLRAELARAREELLAREAEVERLREELAAVEEERRRICDEYVASLDRATEVGNLYVTLRRLHGSLDRGEVLDVLGEVLANLVGTEEFAVLERRGEGVRVVRSMGLAPDRLGALVTLQGALGRVAAAGRIAIGPALEPGPGGPEELTAWIPLRAGEREVGAIAVFRLLGQKPGLGAGDLELFEVLSAHAGLALRSAELSARRAEELPA